MKRAKRVIHGKRRLTTIAFGVAVAMVSLVAIAQGDYVMNTLDNTIDTTPETMALTAGGANGTTQMVVQNQNVNGGDTNNACNLAGSSTDLTVSLSSSNPAVATVSPSSLTFSDCGQPQTVTVTPLSAGSTTISATQTAYSGTGLIDVSPAAFTVNVAGAANAAPNVSAISGDATADEGQTKTYSVSASDPDGDPLSYAWSVTSGNASINGATNGSSASVDFTDGPSTVGLQVIVSDDHGHSVTKTLSVDEANVAPTVVLSGASSADEGQTKTYTYTVTDPGDDPNPTITESCGNDATKTDTAAANSFDCTFSDGPGNSEVKVTADDGDPSKNVGSDKIDVTVANVAPTLSALTLTGNGATACSAGNSVGLKFTFSDPAGDADKPYAGVIDWGDGHTDSFSDYSVDTSHTYAAGTYTIKVDVTDKDGGSAAQKTGQVSLLYNASGILQPINANGSSVFKNGSTIPVKVRITDCNSNPVSGLAPDIAAVKVDSTTNAEVNEDIYSTSAADTGTEMRYDPTAGQYIYNLATKSLSGPGTYRVKVTDPAITPSPVIGQFDVKK